LNKKIIENHKRYLERVKLYQRFGYDLEKERKNILDESLPIAGRILEAGTGKGHFALVLAKAGYQFITFDISEEEQHIAKLNLAYFNVEKSVEYRIENGEHTSFGDNSFDTIFSVNVLHHLRNPYQVINELIRLLAPKGKLVLADFTKKGFEVMDSIHSLEGNKHEVGKVGLKDMEEYLTKKGFSVKKANSVYQYVLIAGRGSI
jgi:2-polyprenyl-3-methyl-5-hydroxy-6-metoxy-1,4-benzoquinol methylase